MSSIRRVPSGRWQARYRDSQGRVRGRTLPTKAEASRFLERTGAEMQRAEWRDPRLGKMTFAEWSAEWERTTLDLRPTTKDLYEYILRSLLMPTFGPMQLARITPLTVRAWLAELTTTQLSPSSVNRAFRLLRRIMNVAVESDILVKSPCVGVKPPTVPRNEMQFCTPDQVEDLAEAIDPHFRVLVLAAAYTGLRWGELAGLRRSRVDLLHGTLTVVEQLTEVRGRLAFGPPKTEPSRRRIKLSGFLVKLLDEQLAERAQPSTDGLVFATRNGEAMRRNNFRRTYWLPAVSEAGLTGLRFHDLRHTAVALAIANGAHAKTIQQRMGHSSVTITLDRYGHLLPTLDDQIADGLERMRRLAVADRSSAVPTELKSIGSGS